MPKPRSQILVVPDINVFVSGTAITNSYPAQVIDLWREGHFQIATSIPILRRMREVYLYPHVVKFTGKTKGQVARFLKDLREEAVVVSGDIPVEASPDPDDNKIFSCAVEAGADYIVSGDKHDVLSVGTYRGIRTISPRDFVGEVLLWKKAA